MEAIDQTERALIDQLISATKLYNSSEAIKELFDFVVRFRKFAPFNAMLLAYPETGIDSRRHCVGLVEQVRSRPKTRCTAASDPAHHGTRRFRFRHPGYRRARSAS